MAAPISATRALAPRGLLERDDELERLLRAVAAAERGDGALAVVEGEAGIGKTSLLDAVCAEARERGFSVLRARGGELERDFGFGVVRQLFEAVLAAEGGAGRAELLEGVAAIVEPIFGRHGDLGASPGQDASFAAQHGLYWLAANLASRAPPLLLCVDDAQWADPASLRWLVYLARRLEGDPVAVVVAVRSGEANAPAELLEAVGTEASETVVPQPLTEAASANVVRTALGPSADAVFCRACHETTGGNPFLLSELVSALARGDVEASAAGARRVRELGPSAVARSLLLRLSRLPEEATVLARAVAVLDTDADVHLAAAVAGIDAGRALAAAEALVRSEILAAGEPLRFRHPILRAAVYEELPSSRRALEHRGAAEVLASRNPDRAAVHLLSTAPAGDPWVAEQLLRAGERAAARGAIDAATALLDRCLAEPPPPSLLARAHLARGRAAHLAADHATARRALATVVELSDDPVVRAQAAAELAVSWFLGGDLQEATRALNDAIEVLPEEAAQSRAEIALARTMIECSAPLVPAAVVGSSLKELIATADPSWPSYPLFAAFALLTPYFAAEVGFDDVARLLPGARHLDAAVEVRDTDAHHLQAGLAITGLQAGGEIEAVQKACESWVRRAREQGAMALLTSALVLRARVRVLVGRLREAVVDAREAVQLSALVGTPLVRRMAMGPHLWALTELGRLDEADRLLEEHGLDGAVPIRLVQDGMFICQRAQLRLGQHRVAEALADMEAADRWVSGRGICSFPYLAYLRRPEFLLAAGRTEEATAAARESLANVARLPPVYRGLVLRSAGVVIGGDEGIDLLRAACDGLDASPMPVEHARALLGLGAALRRAGQRADAREPLAHAMELAHTRGAQPLADAARSELVATGARPRRLVRSGIDALTPSELRVAKLVAEGMSNPQIAQQLFVTRRTVETHVAAILRKLDLKGREGIAAALARDAPAPPAPAPDATNAIVTVLFTDMVHDATMRELLAAHGGREVKTLGDGFLSVFDRSANAVACAVALRDAMQELGLPVRVGLHAGEVEIAVRIAALADAGEVLLSAAVRDLGLGTPMRLVPHGRHTLEGVPGEWDILRAVAP